jgi:phosphoglucosamine mutase
MGRLFGTDGIRGVAGTDLTEVLARDVGRAAVAVLGRDLPGRPAFVVGRDPRLSGEGLEAALAEGIVSAGGDVLIAGIQTTPAVAFLTTELNASAGVVISASHNPPEYNGIKFFSPSGYKLPGEVEDRIEEALGAGATRAGRGEVRPLADATERYLDHLTAAAEGSLGGLTVVVDCASGAAAGVAPEALRRLGAEVHVLAGEPDGSRINVGSGATHPEVVAAEVKRVAADAGVSLDGDADRALFADPDGAVIDGDQVLAACALSLRDRGRLPGDCVVTTVMANLGFRRRMEEAGIEVVTAGVGDRYVLEEMLRTGAVLGGEQSGHIIFREHATTGDGILTAIKFLSLAQDAGLPVAKFAGQMRRFPQVLLNVTVADRSRLEGARGVWDAVRGAEAALAARGRVLVRPSGTEPLVRVMVEAESEAEARRHAEDIAAAVRAELI